MGIEGRVIEEMICLRVCVIIASIGQAYSSSKTNLRRRRGSKRNILSDGEDQRYSENSIF